MWPGNAGKVSRTTRGRVQQGTGNLRTHNRWNSGYNSAFLDEEKPAVVEQKETITEIPDDPVLETKTEYTKVPVSDSGKLTLSINKPVVNTPKLDFEVDEIDPELAVSEAEFLNGVLWQI